MKKNASGPHHLFRLNAFARALLLAGAAAPGLAAAFDGPYLGVEGGVNWANGANVLQNNQGIGSIKYNTGFAAGIVGGYAWPFGLRPEFEFDYRRNTLKNATFGGGYVPAGGFNDVYTGMGNLWYDFRMPGGFYSRIHPYVGGGVGVARVGFHHANVAGFQFSNDHNFTLAYQGGAGVGFDLTRNVTLSLDWRYLQTDHEGYNFGLPGGETGLRYRAQTAMLGLRVGMGAPPPPPPPPPVAAAPQPPPPPPPPAPVCKAPPGFQVDANCNIIEQKLVVRQVDFMFNSDQLTAPAQATLDEIAAALQQQPSLTIAINGYTDSIGSATYNRKLSQRRADSVRSYLASKGVNPGNLNAQGYGKDNPIASNDTDEGRAQNRRVEFVISNPPEHVKVEQQGATPETTQAALQGEQPGATKRHHRHRRRHHAAPQATPPPADQTSPPSEQTPPPAESAPPPPATPAPAQPPPPR